MRAVLQRVTEAKVDVEGKIVGSTVSGKPGILILLGVTHQDTAAESEFLARKTTELRFFEDEAGKMNLSVKDVGGSALVVSQFTLFADWKKGRRPGFSRAALPEVANQLYEHFVASLRGSGLEVQTGIFGAHMRVALVNDGPVTLILDTAEKTD